MSTKITKNMKIVRLACIGFCLGLSACIGTPPTQAELAYYDLPGSAPSLSSPSLPSPLRSLDVTAAPWLDGNAMYYRLAYTDASRREHFAGSRWSGEPADLLEIRLKRSLMDGSAERAAETRVATTGTTTAITSITATSHCRLRVDLDDLSQVFDAPDRSHMQLDARATLYGAHQAILARRVLSLSHPAGMDARSGVAAAGPLADELARELQAWVGQNCRTP